MPRSFKQVDVFGERPLAGNPLAVVRGAEGMPAAQMQQFAHWMNLSETAFLLEPGSPEADYRVRIFTPAQELPFAGHPTLGSCHAWLEWGGEPRDPDTIVQECGAGLVPIRRDPHGFAFAAPPLVRSGPVEPDLVRDLTDVLRLEADMIVDSQWVDNGPGWVALLLPDADAVLAVDGDRSRWTRQASLDVGLVGPHPPGSAYAFEIRGLFTDDQGLREDPVTGSLNASVGQWLFDSGRATSPYVARQGTRLGRTGLVQVERDDRGTVWVGGATATLIEGTAALP